MPLVSVIVPNYNHAEYLTKRIQSILDQRFGDFEVILLDDCSTDNSARILESYRTHPKVSHIVVNTANSGSTFRQWKKGISLARGEWIWIAESDDWAEPTLLEELITPSFTHPDLVLSFCQSILVTPEGNILSKTPADSLYALSNGTSFVKKHLLSANRIWNASMTIFKKGAFGKVPEKYMDMVYAGDWFIWANICLQGSVFVSGKYLNYYLRHINNVATNAEKKGYEFLEGNEIFTYLNRQLDILPEEKTLALYEMTETYLRKEPILLNGETRKAVYASMISLDPVVKDMIADLQKSKLSHAKRTAIRKMLHLPVQALQVGRRGARRLIGLFR